MLDDLLAELDECAITLSRENYNCPKANAALAAFREATK